MSKSKVSVLKVKPATILDDVERLCSLADMKGALAAGATTILKDNISCTTRSRRPTPRPGRWRGRSSPCRRRA